MFVLVNSILAIFIGLILLMSELSLSEKVQAQPYDSTGSNNKEGKLPKLFASGSRTLYIELELRARRTGFGSSGKITLLPDFVIDRKEILTIPTGEWINFFSIVSGKRVVDFDVTQAFLSTSSKPVMRTGSSKSNLW
jgi:hypothetical protein